MQQALEQLRQAIQHALALGLARSGGLEPLREALSAIQAYDALAPLAESLQRLLSHTDTRARLNELASLYLAAEQCLAHLHARALPHRASDLATEPKRQVAAPRLSDEQLFSKLFRGEWSLIEVLPTLHARVAAWQPSEPLLLLQLTLAHSGTAYLAIERLRAMGADAVPLLIRLANSKSPMTRLRACELLLDHTGRQVEAALRGALPLAPRALPLFQKLRAHPHLHGIFVKADAAPLEQQLEGVQTREQLRQLLRHADAQIMLQPPDSPAVEQLLAVIQRIARGETDYWSLLAAVPHERATRLLVEPPVFQQVGFEHLIATLDYRLVPLVTANAARFRDSELLQLSSLGDAAFLPWVVQAKHASVRHYGEPVQLLRNDG